MFQAKLEAIRCYRSQFHNPESDEPITYIATGGFLESIRHRDALMGKRIGTEYGEGFVCENTPGIVDLDQLILPELA